MMEEWQLRSMEEHAQRKGWLSEEAVLRLVETVRRLKEVENSRYEENRDLRSLLERAVETRIDDQWLRDVRRLLGDREP